MKPYQTIRYKYKLPAVSAILMVLAAFLLTIAFVYISYTKISSSIVNVLWGLTACSGLGASLVLWIAIRSQMGSGYVELGPTDALVPKASLSMSLITVPYTAIKQVNVLNFSNQQIAVISSAVGEARLNSKCFPTFGEFTEFLEVLQERRLGNQATCDPMTESLMRTIQLKSKDDPLIGAKIGAKEIYQRLVEGMKSDKGVHIASLLCAIGALAGYSCQASIREQALEKGVSPNSVFHLIETIDGKKYYFGDSLNAPLAESQYSIWGLAAGAAQQIGCNELPDINEIFQYTTQVLGSEKFGIPRVSETHNSSDTPINYLKALWPLLHPTVKLFCPRPADWPILFGLVIQESLYAGHTVIDPNIALKIVMESAISMSKVDLISY